MTLPCKLKTKLGQGGRKGAVNNEVCEIVKGTKIVKG